jgi:hypothetical protein
LTRSFCSRGFTCLRGMADPSAVVAELDAVAKEVVVAVDESGLSVVLSPQRVHPHRVEPVRTIAKPTRALILDTNLSSKFPPRKGKEIVGIPPLF